MDCIASGSLTSAACQKVLNAPQALAKLKQICQEPANRNKTVCIALNTVPGGLGRSAPGPWNDAANGGPTMAQLQAVYDPSLVNLLVPELVASPTSTDGQAAGGGRTK